MDDRKPDPNPFDPFDPKKLQEAAAAFGEALAQVSRGFAAQAALGYAYRGDLDGLGQWLDRMTPEQLLAVSVAADLLGSATNHALARRPA